MSPTAKVKSIFLEQTPKCQTETDLGFMSIAIVIFFSILDMVAVRQDFPFAPYEMFANIVNLERKAESLRLVIVMIKKTGDEILLDNSFIYPVDKLRLAQSLAGSLNNSAQLNEKLKDVLQISRHLRVHEPHLPEFSGVRLYQQPNLELLCPTKN